MHSKSPCRLIHDAHLIFALAVFAHTAHVHDDGWEETASLLARWWNLAIHSAVCLRVIMRVCPIIRAGKRVGARSPSAVDQTFTRILQAVWSRDLGITCRKLSQFFVCVCV